MIKDNANSVLYDVCVIGSGPVGIVVALEYARLNADKKVALIEYGSRNQPATNKLDDAIEIKNLVNHHPPYECTNKGLGGSSATWGGRCVMYDDVDFIDRSIVNDGCTWQPSIFTDAKKYLPIAVKYFECGDPAFDLKEIEEFKNTRIAENFKPGHITDTVVERWSMPTRFGSRYAEEIAQQANLTLIENTAAVSFSAPGEDGTVADLTIINNGTGEVAIVRAKNFVIAAGTQETTRLLLRNPQMFNKIGGAPKSLGKYYQGHVSGKIASIKFTGDPKKTDYGFLRDKEGIYLRRRFQFSADFLKEKNLLNTAIWLDNPLYFDPKHKSGAMSFMYLAMITPILGKKLAPPAIAHSVTKGKVTKVHKHLWNIVRGLPGSLITPFSIFYKRYLLKRKLPGVFLYSPTNTYALHFHAEQVPEESNRMELAADGETLLIHYELMDADVNSVIQLHDELDKWLRETGAGELQYWYGKEELPAAIRSISKDGIHQSGTTRIAASAKDGVVDEQLKIFGTSNVYIASCSNFPTSGQANPTFMAGVFSVRLAHHLSAKDK
ncbi:MAG: GMC oxidoreductase [Chitinophagaceae bacterium]